MGQFRDRNIRGIFPAKQQGATLVLGLVMLLVLTILGVTSTATSQLELKMSSNQLDQTRSFLQAENARVEAELMAIQTADNMRLNAAKFDCTTTGFFGISPDSNTVNCTGLITDPKAHDWATKSRNVSGNSDRYIIEYLGTQTIVPHTDTDRGTALEETRTAYVFRLTVRGLGKDGAVTYIQAVYSRV